MKPWEQLKSWIWHYDLLNVYRYRRLPHIYFVRRIHNSALFTFATYHWICNESSTTGATCGAGTAYPPGAHGSTPGNLWGLCCLIVSFLCIGVWVIVCPFASFSLSLHCLSFDLLNLLTTLISKFSSRTSPMPFICTYYHTTCKCKNSSVLFLL